MNRFLKYWRLTRRGEAFCAHVVAYADDFVILSRGRATEALAWTKAVMTRLGVTLNEAKTSLKNARQERFAASNPDAWPEVCDTVNKSLLGWSNYFCHGTRRAAFRAIDRYVYERVRDFLARRHKVAGRGTHPFSFEVVFGERGLLSLDPLPLTAPSCTSR